METKKQSLFNRVYDRVQQSFFDIMLDLLREKVTNTLTACFLMFVMFLQIVSQLFDANFFDWNDQFLLEIFKSVCDYMRVLKAIEKANNQTYYFILFYLGLSYITVILLMLTYHYYALQKREYYVQILVKSLRLILSIQYWILFMPFFESFISIFNCNGDGNHYLVADLECYSSIHIIYCVLAALGLLFQLSLNTVIALLYNETQPVKEDSLSRLESTFELLLLFYRIFVCSFTMLCHDTFCGWILLFVYLSSGITLSYQYFIYIPYYNQFVSIFFGSIINIYTWIAVNCLLTKLWIVSGHMIVIVMGCPLIIYIVIYLRQQRIEFLMDNTMEKISNDVDALIQINMIKDLSVGRTGSRVSGDSINSVESEMKIKGIINLHFEECKNDQCICRNLEELYCVNAQDFLTPTQELHNETIFIAHYNKKLFEEAIGKFIQSPGLHISFSFYLFQVMKNVHASLHELSVAQKKKPTIQQQFTIFRYKYIIENFVKNEEQKTKHIYQQLTKVKEFENLYQEMQRAIEQVCNFQVEFWSQLTTAIPDLNVLNDLGNKIYSAAEKADYFWNELRHINPSYPAALQHYGEYLSLIRNNPQVGKQFIDKATNHTVSAVVSDNNFVKKSEILFTEDTTVIHISGNRDSSGKILHVSNGLHKCFGYTKSEVVGHNVSFLMPGTIGIRHNEFLEKFYKTGRQVVFNNERPVFALNKSKHCFYAKVLVKQMPSLKEGVQYVGMVRPTYTEFDYIICNMSGLVDSYSKGVSNLLGISPASFTDNNAAFNIMIICPELIELFEERRKATKSQIPKRINSELFNNEGASQTQVQPEQNMDPDKPFTQSKFSQPGGGTLALIVPKDFANIARQEKSVNKQTRQVNNTSSSKKKNQQMESSMDLANLGVSRSNAFSDFMKYLAKNRTFRRVPNLSQLLRAKEYKEHEKLKLVQCEIEIQESRINRSDLNSLKYIVLKIRHPGSKSNKDIHDRDFPGQQDNEQDNEDNQSQGLDDEQDQLNLMKTANQHVQDVFGPKDDSSKNNQAQVFGAFRYQFQKYFRNNFLAGLMGNMQKQNDGAGGGKGDNSKQFVAKGPWAELIAYKERMQKEKEDKEKKDGGESNRDPTSKKVGFSGTPDSGEQDSSRRGSSNGAKKQNYSVKEEYKGDDSPKNNGYLNTKTQAKTMRDQKEQKEGGGQQANGTKYIPKITYKSSFKTDSEINLPGDGDDGDMKKSETKSTVKFSTKQQPSGETQQAGAKQVSIGIVGGGPSTKGPSPSQIVPTLNISGGNSNKVVPIMPVSSNSVSTKQAAILEQQDTPRIDVKKDIVINDKIKKKTATYQAATTVDPTAFKTPLDTINQEPSITSTNKRTSIANTSTKQPVTRGETATKQNTRTGHHHHHVKKNTAKEKHLDASGNIVQGSDDEKQSKATAVFKKESMKSVKKKGTTTTPDGGGGGAKTTPGAAPEDLQNESMTSVDLDGESEEYEEDEEYEEIYEEEEEEDIQTEIDEAEANENEGLLRKQTMAANQSNRVVPFNKQQTMAANRLNQQQTQIQQANSAAWPVQQDSHNTNSQVDQVNLKKKKVRNYEKIVTNKKDVHLDIETCGTGMYFREWDPSQDELNIREIIKKSENRKMKQERRRRKQQMMKQEDKAPADPLNASVGNEGGAEGGDGDLNQSMSLEEFDTAGAASTANTQGADSAPIPAEESSKKAAAVHEDDDEISEDEHHHSSNVANQMHDDQQGGDVSSVASSMYSQMRSYFTLRNSIDEKFVPLSIKNLKNVAGIVFFALLVLNITQFAIQRSLFEQVNQNIQNIHHSESRISHIIDINLRIQNLRFLNEGLLSKAFFYKLNETQYRMEQNELLLISATALQDAQTSLSLATSGFEEGIRKQINPNNVVIVYDDQPQNESQPVAPAMLEFNIWESVIKIVVSTYEITTSPMNITSNNPLVKFIQDNCLNSLLGALRESTQAIIVATDGIRTSSLNLFLYLLIAVSCSLLISVGFLLPIISRAKRSKQDVLELFLHKKIEKGIDDHLKICRWFISKYQIRVETGTIAGVGGGEHEGGIDEQHIQNVANQEGGMTEQDLKKEKEELYNMKKQKKKKKWRKLNINFGYLSLQLLVIVLVLETFYLVNYVLSNTFMSEVSSLTSELRLLISREPLYMLVLLTQKELFYSNGSARILGQSVRNILTDYNRQLIEDEQSLLELFSSNYQYHTVTYNTQFNGLMYSSICDELETLNPYMISEEAIFDLEKLGGITSKQQLTIYKDECEEFNLGILKKGLYSTVTKYLSSLKQIDSQFMLLRKPNETARDYINDDKVIMSERTCDIYMKKIHEYLVSVLEDDINTFFNKEYKFDIAIFILFIAYLLFIYFFVWRIFLSNLLDELWKAKSMLSVLPIETCFKIEEIRLFIYANSSTSKVK